MCGRQSCRGSYCLWFVFLFACQWCDEIVMISAQPVAEPNMDTDAGWTICLKLRRRIKYLDKLSPIVIKFGTDLQTCRVRTPVPPHLLARGQMSWYNPDCTHVNMHKFVVLNIQYVAEVLLLQLSVQASLTDPPHGS